MLNFVRCFCPSALLEEVLYFFLNFFFNIYLFLRQRETEREWGRGREREEDTESEAGSRIRAGSTELDGGLELTNRKIMT